MGQRPGGQWFRKDSENNKGPGDSRALIDIWKIEGFAPSGISR